MPRLSPIELMRQMADDDTPDTDWTDATAQRERSDALAAAYERLQIRHTFAPGQQVQWKQGMKYTTHPSYGEPVVVLEVVDPPFQATNADHGVMTINTLKLDLVLGVIDDDGDLVPHRFPSDRFEPFVKPDAPAPKKRARKPGNTTPTA